MGLAKRTATLLAHPFCVSISAPVQRSRVTTLLYGWHAFSTAEIALIAVGSDQAVDDDLGLPRVIPSLSQAARRGWPGRDRHHELPVLDHSMEDGQLDRRKLYPEAPPVDT